jgi:hypothetical protein
VEIMVALKVQDGKKQSRILNVEGKILSDGTRVAGVLNDVYTTYVVIIHPNGQSTCKQEKNGVACTGHFHTGHCYHVDAVKNAPLSYEHDDCVTCGRMIPVGKVICSVCLGG